VTELGRYRLSHVIKRGANAEIWEARLIAGGDFERRVALKRALSGADPTFVKSFLDEARIASQLHHANIVPVIDVGELDGVPFQVQELVDGLSLDAIAEASGGRVAPEIVLHVGAVIGEALEYAHRARDRDGRPLGIVHRDVTPENVLVSWEGDLKLVDFGNAHARRKQAVTEIGIVKGKLHYLSPEQAQGRAVGPETDVFALGCVLHRLSAGRSPLDGMTIVQIGAGTPPVIDPSLPLDLSAIIRRAVEVSVAHRHRSAEDLARACAAALAGRAVYDARARLKALMAVLRAERTDAPIDMASDRPRKPTAVYTAEVEDEHEETTAAREVTSATTALERPAASTVPVEIDPDAVTQLAPSEWTDSQLTAPSGTVEVQIEDPTPVANGPAPALDRPKPVLEAPVALKGGYPRTIEISYISPRRIQLSHLLALGLVASASVLVALLASQPGPEPPAVILAPEPPVISRVEPIAIAPEPEVDAEPAPEPDSEPETAPAHARPRTKASKRSGSDPMAEVRAEVALALGRRSLTIADARADPVLARDIRALEAAAEAKDRSAAQEAARAIDGRLAGWVASPAIVDAKLKGVSSRLLAVSKVGVEKGRAEALEQEYFDLRARYRRDLGKKECSELFTDVVALERKIDALR
jgi:serine/threonine protein kinase